MLKSILRKTYKKFAQTKLVYYINALRFRNSQKVFCIGRNKTGTTSMAVLFRKLGLYVAAQRPAELLTLKWAQNDCEELIKYVKYSGEAFQDVPFSLPCAYQVLDKKFPNSKFILTIRDSPEEWYKSLTSFHAKLFGNGSIPIKRDLQEADYVYPGWMWELNRFVYNAPENDIYNEKILKKHYLDHNSDVVEYFKKKPNKLLVVNLKDEDAASKIIQFLGMNVIIEDMPWMNKAQLSEGN